MDIDEAPRRRGLTSELAAEDLSAYSVDDLQERIGALRTEIERCEGLISSKQGSLEDAERFFKI